MSCANCGAEYPTSRRFGTRLRLLAVSGGLLVFASMILSDCVINHLPGGRDSGYRAPGSKQVALGPGPMLKSPAVQATLQAWMHNEQQSQNPGVSIGHRK